MKHEDPKTRLIREQERYIRILEEQVKAQELLIEEQNQALVLFAEAFREEGE